MHFYVYDVYYSQFSHQHLSAGEKMVVAVAVVVVVVVVVHFHL